MLNGDTILVLAPHTDDGEFGCGGSISKWVSEGKKVFYVAFSTAEKSVPDNFPKDILKRELKKAMKLLGIPLANLILFDYPVREFSSHRQEILEDLIKLSNELNPDLVLLPSTRDTHQDHQTIANEGFRAFKKTSILGYEMPYNNLTFTTNFFVSLQPDHLVRKMRALKCYKSQKDRNYATEEFIASLAQVRGIQIGRRYAEAFEAIRCIIK